jgi:hypothetical protein|tara:strand:- start:109 stop:585 length:477 start_codon:yes stop_codon:yes gene_type:complete
MKLLLTVWVVSLILILPNFVYSQSLREFFSNIPELNRDDLPETEDGIEEMSLDELICKNKELFPKKTYDKKYANFIDCKYNLDRIQEATYVDLTFRIRWDNDRLDLYRTNSREIFICDQEKMSIYEHSQKKDPDWWMIVRTSLEFIECENEISVEIID